MKLSKSQIKKLDKLSKKKPIMVRVGHTWYTWYESDENGVWLTTQGGDEKEFKYKEIDDIQEGITKITKSQLREMIRKEIQHLNEDKIRMGFAGFDSYFTSIERNIESVGRTLKTLIKDLAKDTKEGEADYSKQVKELQIFYKKYIIEMDIKFKQFKRKNT